VRTNGVTHGMKKLQPTVYDPRSKRCSVGTAGLLNFSAKTADKKPSMFHTLNRSGIVYSPAISAPLTETFDGKLRPNDY